MEGGWAIPVPLPLCMKPCHTSTVQFYTSAEHMQGYAYLYVHVHVHVYVYMYTFIGSYLHVPLDVLLVKCYTLWASGRLPLLQCTCIHLITWDIGPYGKLWCVCEVLHELKVRVILAHECNNSP